MTTEHRRAPKRKVLEISKTGAWGSVTYQHKLSCGHIESRPRASTSASLACVWCLRSEKKSEEIKSLSAPPVLIIDAEEEQSLTDFEMTVEKVRAGIAAKFSVPADAVDVSVGDVDGKFVIKSAIVFLSPLDVARISKS
jgi:hypothetical protein